MDSDFSGLLAVEDGLTPSCVKSRTGYVIKFCDVPVIWVSNMQTQIALSNMEAEYTALSQSKRDLIPIRDILKEIMMEVLDDKFKPECTTHSKEVCEDNIQCRMREVCTYAKTYSTHKISCCTSTLV
jgi:NH3-dependent NAD+ synthetase